MHLFNYHKTLLLQTIKDETKRVKRTEGIYMVVLHKNSGGRKIMQMTYDNE